MAREDANLASEFYVASQLFRLELPRLGKVATITLGQAKQIDLVVTDPRKPGRTVTIDLKGLKRKDNWPIGELSSILRRRDHFYVLISYLDRFSELGVQPDAFIIPSMMKGIPSIERIVSPWSGRPDLKCVGYRTVKGSKYENAWHLLFHEAPRAPVGDRAGFHVLLKSRPR